MVAGGSKKTGKVNVPNIIGLTSDKAEKLVKDAGLKFVVKEEPSDKPKGVVIKCYPSPGTTMDLSENDEVRVIISSGSENTGVPNLVDIDFETAKEYLNMYNLKLGEVTYKYSNSVEKGKVCDQSPKAGSEIKPDTTVDLVISKGSQLKMTTVPNLINKKLDEVEGIVSSAGLRLGTVNKIPTTDKEKDGLVTVQSIESGTRVKQQTIINISCYSFGNKDIVKVPNFVNKTVKEARILAEQNDLSISFRGRDDFIIVSQDKAPGSQVAEGTSISLKTEPNP